MGRKPSRKNGHAWVDLLTKDRGEPTWGDYVLATKYGDGGSRDPWFVGFLRAFIEWGPGDRRYLVFDSDGNSGRATGFRAAVRISKEKGEWLLRNREDLEMSGDSVFFHAKD